jgi:hypothetical protein
MNSQSRRRQFTRFKINSLIAFSLVTIMIVSAIGLGFLLWYELTDPERLEPQPNRSFRTCWLDRSSQVSDPAVFPSQDKLDSVGD